MNRTSKRKELKKIDIETYVYRDDYKELVRLGFTDPLEIQDLAVPKDEIRLTGEASITIKLSLFDKLSIKELVQRVKNQKFLDEEEELYGRKICLNF